MINPGKSLAARPDGPSNLVAAMCVSELRRFDYHPRALTLTPTGVKDFFLPAVETSAAVFFDEFCIRGAAFLRQRGIDRDRTAEAVWLVLIFMASEATVYLEMTQIADSCAKKGLLATFGNNDKTSVLASIAMGQTPPSVQVRSLRSRCRRPSHIHDWTRWAASPFKDDGYSRRPPALLNRRHDILCFSGTRGQAELAQTEGKRLVLSTFDQWFDNLPDDSALPPIIQPELITALIDIAASIFTERQVVLPPHVRAGLFQCFTTLTRMSLCLLEMIERKARRLPTKFWAISMGSIYNRVISRVVQKEGGEVVGHDHGTGSGTMFMPLQMQVDWDFCDSFLTYTEAHAAGIRSQIDQRYRVRARPVSIGVSPSPLYDASSRFGENSAHSQGPLRICYAPPHYGLEYYYVTPIPFDMAMLDFQVRLLTHLKRAGHEVIYKPHPLCHVGIVEDLVRLTGVRMDTRPFEDLACDDIDVALVGHAQSTVIRSVLLTDMSLVILDPGRIEILPPARELLLRRAEIVALDRNEENRINLNTDRLDSAIQRSLTLRDRAFQQAYYPAV